MRVFVLAMMVMLAGCNAEQAEPDNGAGTSAPAQAPSPANAITGADVNETMGDGPQPPFETRVIPAAFHGRWALTDADCAASGSAGLMTVSANEIKTNSVTARPVILTLVGDKRIDGNFAGTRGGVTDTLLMQLMLSADGRTLTRIVDHGDSAPSPEGSRFAYRRC